MFYEQFSKITNLLNPEFVERFDYWLATLPSNNQKNITASSVAARLGVSYTQAEEILKYAERQKILEKEFLVKCPDCDSFLDIVKPSQLNDVIAHPAFCVECEEEKHITTDDIYVAYNLIMKPNATEAEISKAIERKLNCEGSNAVNFTTADSLSNDLDSLYEAFYNPSESAYRKFVELRDKLDWDYGKNRTEKGKALEKLILGIFGEIKHTKATNDVKTQTNQFDCTVLCGVKTVFPSILNLLTPYFIVECKNEKKKPDNTYTNKIESILDTNAAQLGIVFGRKDATKPCFTISREHYLTKKNGSKQQIIITCCDNDLEYIIDKQVNLLEYLEFKVFQITTNSPKATYEMFCTELRQKHAT